MKINVRTWNQTIKYFYLCETNKNDQRGYNNIEYTKYHESTSNKLKDGYHCKSATKRHNIKWGMERV